MPTIHIDENRILIKEASPEKITGKWKEAVDEIIKTCNEHLGSKLISIYIGGSVSHGDAIEDKSDVDSYVVVNLTEQECKGLDDVWVLNEEKRIDTLFPFQRGVEIHLIPADHISEGKKFQMKVFSARVYGKDFGLELHDYKLDRETMGRIRVDAKKDIETAKEDLAGTDDAKEIMKVGKWISKRIIRSSGMLCMWKENSYTMEIPKLVQMVSQYYPEKKEELDELFEYTKNPTSNKVQMQHLLRSFGAWLIEEDKNIFG
ncbi:MAG: nucleotidyltransferase domain-containing protein [Patescibacteria group bacterium]